MSVIVFLILIGLIGIAIFGTLNQLSDWYATELSDHAEGELATVQQSQAETES